jgi:hypothetical protein
MAELNPRVVKEKTVDLAFAARTVIQQLASKDRSPEGVEAQRLLEDALTNAIPDVNSQNQKGQGKSLLAA